MHLNLLQRINRNYLFRTYNSDLKRSSSRVTIAIAIDSSNGHFSMQSMCVHTSSMTTASYRTVPYRNITRILLLSFCMYYAILFFFVHTLARRVFSSSDIECIVYSIHNEHRCLSSGSIRNIVTRI